jgi:hypothetical protein
MYRSIVELINMKKLYFFISIGVSLLLPLNALGQMGARMPPIDYDEGSFSNPSDWWLTLLWAIILFAGPALIAKNKDGDDAGIEYWKWWFITLVGSFTILLFFKTPLASLLSSIAILIYGINRK